VVMSLPRRNCDNAIVNALMFTTQPKIGAGEKRMKTKFLVKVNRVGAHAPQYVQRLDRTPIETTPNRKLALVMGRFTAEDAIKSMQNSRCAPELVPVQVSA
jgi:hypothetical protein